MSRLKWVHVMAIRARVKKEDNDNEATWSLGFIVTGTMIWISKLWDPIATPQIAVYHFLIRGILLPVVLPGFPG